MFRSEFKGLCFFAQKYVKDHDASREIVQDAFLSLWEKRDEIDTSRPVKSYLTTAIHHKCLNHLRNSRKFSQDILNFENLLELPEEALADALVEKELSQRISRAIEELPEKCREVFLLNRHENLKYNEIAEKLQLSPKTVEAHMSKALQHMRIHLAEFMTILLALATSCLVLLI